jgi:hypothetical protein
VSAFVSYNGPKLSFSNLLKRPGSGVVTYFERMQDARRVLLESFESVKSALNSRNRTADVAPAIELVERGIRAVNAAPLLDPRADQFRGRLLELLTQQKNLLSEFAQSVSKDPDTLRRDENALIVREEQFASEYQNWLPGFLKERGYELRETDDR